MTEHSCGHKPWMGIRCEECQPMKAVTSDTYKIPGPYAPIGSTEMVGRFGPYIFGYDKADGLETTVVSRIDEDGTITIVDMVQRREKAE